MTRTMVSLVLTGLVVGCAATPTLPGGFRTQGHESEQTVRELGGRVTSVQGSLAPTSKFTRVATVKVPISGLDDAALSGAQVNNRFDENRPKLVTSIHKVEIEDQNDRIRLIKQPIASAQLEVEADP